MAASVKIQDFKTLLYDYIEFSTQEERGKDIDVLIDDIAKTKFDELPKECMRDKMDKVRFNQIKNRLMITSICLAIISTIAAIAGIVFSSWVASASSMTLAALSGIVGITTSLHHLDSSFDKYISYCQKDRKSKMQINKLQDKINDVATLIKAQISCLEHIDPTHKLQRAKEVFDQIKKVNGFIKSIKEKIPTKLMKLDVFDPYPLNGLVS